MSKPRARSALRRELTDLIQTCESIENRKFNPFLLDVSEALRLLRLHASRLNSLEEHLLDVRALTGIAKVVGLQSAQLRFRSSKFFVDPEMARSKIDALSRQQLAEFFLLSWHPIVELEQLTQSTIGEAIGYWKRLLPFFERRKRLELPPMATAGAASLGDLTRAGLLDDKAFTTKLGEILQEMKRMILDTGSAVDYWKFVTGKSFQETVVRAQFVSFLLTYGYASLERVREQFLLTPRETPAPLAHTSPVSLPIAIRQDK